MAPFVRRETIEALRQALTDERAIVRVDAYGSLVFLQPDIETSTDPTVVRARREYRYRQEFIRADDPRWLANFVEWHFGRGEIEHAEKYARHALRLAPRDPLHWANLATLLLATNRLPEATEHAERLSQLDPKGARTGVVLSSILLALGRPRDAFIKIQEFDQKDPHVQRMTTVIRARIRSGF
jgi:predicted Zn-dependent protease